MEQLEKTVPMVKQLVSSDRDWQAVEADLALLSVELDTLVGTSGKIRDLVLELRLSLPVLV